MKTFLFLYYNYNIIIYFINIIKNKYLKLIILTILTFFVNYFTKENLIINNFNKFISNNTYVILPKDKNDPIILKEKLNLLEFISKNIGKKITEIKTIFVGFSSNFGNQLIYLNKVIFYCEILGCRKIILNKNYFWFINKRLYDKNHKMIIEKGDINKYNNKGILIDNTINFYYYINYIRPEFRINLLKKEIFRNIPKVIIDKKDLFIYIRSGDIFLENPHIDYSQPPLCFYQKIVINYKFNNIYIIASDTNNPNINILLKQFPKIIFMKNSLELDISYLSNAFNLVGAQSTFFFSILQLNNNVKFLWEFDFDRHNESRTNFLEQFINYIYIPKKNITTYRMKSSLKYKKEMTNWNCSQNQIYLMINDDCPFNFQLYNI